MNQDKTAQQGSPFEIVTTTKSKSFGTKNIIAAIFVFLFLGASVFSGVYLLQQRQNLSEKAAPASTIYITPSTQNYIPGTNFSFTVDIDTATNAVTGIDTRLTFNPAIMKVISLEQGSGVTNLSQTIVNTFDNTEGTISYAIYTLDSSKAVSGSGIEVLKVNAQVLENAALGSYNITFGASTAASASQEGQNVIIAKNPGLLNISSTIDSTPTPTPTSAPVATPTATPSPDPDATANPTATPGPIGGPLNSCGGTCGSNANCQANYVCSGGFCRNPSCTDSQNCVCNTSSSGSSGSTQQATATPRALPVTGTNWTTYLGIGVGAFAVISAIILAL